MKLTYNEMLGPHGNYFVISKVRYIQFRNQMRVTVGEHNLQSTLDISKLWGPFFTNSSIVSNAKFLLEKAIQNIFDLDRRFEFRRIRDIRVRDIEIRIFCIKQYFVLSKFVISDIHFM